MPILATIRRSLPQFVMPDPDARRLDFVSIDGAEVLEWSDESWIIQSGIQGLQVPPRRIVTDEYQGLEGQRVRQVTTGPRTVILPFYVSSTDRQVASHLEQQARIRRFFDYRNVDVAEAEGTFDLVATQQDGINRRRLRCLYVDGMEGLNGIRHGNGPSESTFDAKLLAVAPYWRGDAWTTPTVSLPSSNPFLANDGPAHPLRLSSTVALGANMPLVVPGDIPSSPVIELIGPATVTHITSPAGLDVKVGELEDGDLFVLDTGRTKKALLNGEPAWQLVGASPKWRPLHPGSTTISIEMTGASSASRARVYGDAMWETAW